MSDKKTRTTKSKNAERKMCIEDLLVEVQARFDSIDGKLDTLLSRLATLFRMTSTERDPSFKTHATVNKEFSIPQDRPPRERKMYQAVCAECKKSCEVPFMPRIGRPVYCKICYRNRRNEAGFKNIPNKEEIAAEISKTLNIDITAPSGTQKAKPKKPRRQKSKAKKK